MAVARGSRLGLLPYAVSQVFRGRRRTISSMIGIALTVAFLSGTFIAIDSSLRAVAEGRFAGLQADFVLNVLTNRTQELADELRAIPGILSAAPFNLLYLPSIGRWGETPTSGVQALAVDPDHLPGVFDGTQVQGTMELPRGSAVLSDIVALEAGAVVGDVVFVEGLSYNATSGTSEPRFVNLTIEGIVTIPSGWEPPLFSAGGVPSDRFIAVHIRDGTWLSSELFGQEIDGATFEILVDRNLVLNPYDVVWSQRNLARIGSEIRLVAAPYGETTLYDLVSPIVAGLDVVLPLFRTVYVLLSIPLIILGISLGAVGVDLGHSERRRELAVLKTRGATGSQVWRVLAMESVIVGCLAAILGLIAGVGISRLVAPFVTFFVLAIPRLEDLVFSPGTLALSAAFGVSLAFAATYRSAKRASRLPIVETLRHYSPHEATVRYRPTLDVILVAVGVGTYVLDLTAFLVGPSLLGVLAGPLFFVMLPFAPFLLLIGLTRLLTRATPRFYQAAARLLRPFARNLHHLISQNLRRNPRRASNIALLIALGLAFGIFVLSLTSSFIVREVRILRASIGADMAGLSPIGDETFEDNVTRVAGVAAVTSILPIPALLSLSPPTYSRPDLFALDPGTFFATTAPEPWYFLDGDPGPAQRVLSTAGEVLVSEGFMEDAFLEVRDPLRLVYSDQEGDYLDVTIGGVVRGLPGVSSYADVLPRAVYGSRETFAPILSALTSAGTSPRPAFLVDLNPEADWRAAKEAIVLLGASDVRVYEEERATASRNPAARNMLGFFSVELAFVLVILTAGLALTTYAASLDREVEFAAIIARGASGWQAAALLLGEALSIVVVGGLVGFGAGVAALYGGARVFGAGPGGEAFEPLVPFPFVVPLEALLLVGVTFLVMVFASLLVSWRIARMDVPRVLKLRAG